MKSALFCLQRPTLDEYMQVHPTFLSELKPSSQVLLANRDKCELRIDQYFIFKANLFIRLTRVNSSFENFRLLMKVCWRPWPEISSRQSRPCPFYGVVKVRQSHDSPRSTCEPLALANVLPPHNATGLTFRLVSSWLCMRA